MARPLLANPDLLELFERGIDLPAHPFTFCNRCSIRTAVTPLGCYEPRRFASQAEMERQILQWSGGAPALEASEITETSAATPG